MFPKYTLYPAGGAFMMCESVAEFDQNMEISVGDDGSYSETEASPVAVRNPYRGQVNPVQMNTPQSNKWNDIFNTEHDPIDHAISKLRPIYDMVIRPICNSDLDGVVNSGDYMTAMDNFVSQASNVVNMLRCVIVKQMAMAKMAYCNSSAIIYEPFLMNVGRILPHAAELAKNTSGCYEFTYRYIQDFEPNTVSTVVGAAKDNPAILKSLNMFQTMTGMYIGSSYRPTFFGTFDSAIDMVSMLFDDLKRLENVECCGRNSLSLSSLMDIYRSNISSDEAARADRERYSDSAKCVSVNKEFLCLASKTLRHLSQEVYGCICELNTDEERMHGDYDDCIRDFYMMLVNLFAVGMCVVIMNGIELREILAYRRAVEKYTTQLLDKC